MWIDLHLAIFLSQNGLAPLSKPTSPMQKKVKNIYKNRSQRMTSFSSKLIKPKSKAPGMMFIKWDTYVFLNFRNILFYQCYVCVWGGGRRGYINENLATIAAINRHPSVEAPSDTSAVALRIASILHARKHGIKSRPPANFLLAL